MRTLAPPSSVVAVAIAAVVLATQTALAEQPQAFSHSFAKAKAAGKANLRPDAKRADTRVAIDVANLLATHLLLEVPQCTEERTGEGVVVPDLEEAIAGRVAADEIRVVRAEPRWGVCVRGRSKAPGLHLLRPGETLRLALEIDFRAAGRLEVLLDAKAWAVPDGVPVPARKQVVPADLVRLRRHAGLAAVQAIGLFYEVTGADDAASYRRAAFEDLFLQGPPFEEPSGGFPARRWVDGVPVDLPAFRRAVPTVPDPVHDPDHRDLDLIPTTTGTSDEMCECLDVTGAPCAPDGSRGPLAALSSGIIKGRISAKDVDNVYRPAWGFKVIAWWNDGGVHRNLGETKSWLDGSFFFVAGHPNWTGQNLKLQFLPANSWFEVVNDAEAFYAWDTGFSGPIDLTQAHDAGHWALDNEGGLLYALYAGGQRMLGELVSRAQVNPVRADPVKVIFPNLSQFCSGTAPWSCAHPSGKIWLIPEHANAVVVQHELGHQLHYELWDGKRPDDSTGTHDLAACYTRGLALLEGFANFMPYWVAFPDRTDDATSLPTFPIESPGAGYCKSPGTENEVWVAATFWDLYDAHDDQSDHMHFDVHGAVIKILGQNDVLFDGQPYGIDDLRVPYRNAADPGEVGDVELIFIQNDAD